MILWTNLMSFFAADATKTQKSMEAQDSERDQPSQNDFWQSLKDFAGYAFASIRKIRTILCV